jgi:hypothetical protein
MEQQQKQKQQATTSTKKDNEEDEAEIQWKISLATEGFTTNNIANWY